MSTLFPGERRVWLVAAIVGSLLAAVVIYELLIPREFFVGTNSVRSRSIVTELRAGQELCVGGLQIPGGTGEIEFDVFSRPPRPAFVAKIKLGHGYGASRVRVAASGSRERKVRVPLDLRPLDVDSIPGTVCLQPSGRGAFALGGMLGLQGDDVPPTLGGKPQQYRVAVWFRPPRGTRRSLLASWSDIDDRAALFRPAPVGPWLYWAVFLGVMPLLAYGSLRGLAVAFGGQGRLRSLLLLIALIAFGNGMVWSVITPPFDAPDEYDHYAYSQALAETGEIPCQSCSKPPRSSEETFALEAVRIHSYIESSEGRPPWLEEDERRWRHRLKRAGDVSRRDGGGPTTAATHSPLYYSLTLPAYAAARSGSVFDRLSAIRLTSAVLGALTAVFVALMAAEVMSSRNLGLAIMAGLLVALQPMFAFMSGAVNNDAGVNAACAAAIFFLIRAVKRGLTPPLGCAVGLTLVIAPLMKATAYAVFPAAAVALLAVAYRSRSRRDIPGWLALVAVFFASQVVWTVLSHALDRSSFTTPGGVAPGTSGPVAEALANPAGFASYLWQVFLPRLPFMADVHLQTWPAYDIYVERGWAAFGWYAIQFPPWVYGVIVTMMCVIGGCAAVAVIRNRGLLVGRTVEMLVLVTCIAGVVGAVEASFYTTAATREVVAEQGRYVFTAIGPLALIVVAGSLAFERRWRPWFAATLIVMMLALGVASQLLALQYLYT